MILEPEITKNIQPSENPVLLLSKRKRGQNLSGPALNFLFRRAAIQDAAGEGGSLPQWLYNDTPRLLTILSMQTLSDTGECFAALDTVVGIRLIKTLRNLVNHDTPKPDISLCGQGGLSVSWQEKSYGASIGVEVYPNDTTIYAWCRRDADSEPWRGVLRTHLTDFCSLLREITDIRKFVPDDAVLLRLVIADSRFISLDKDTKQLTLSEYSVRKVDLEGGGVQCYIERDLIKKGQSAINVILRDILLIADEDIKKYFVVSTTAKEVREVGFDVRRDTTPTSQTKIDHAGAKIIYGDYNREHLPVAFATFCKSFKLVLGEPDWIAYNDEKIMNEANLKVY